MSRSKLSPSCRLTTLGLDASGSPVVSVVNASWLSMASPSVLFARSVVVPRFPRCPQARNRFPTYRVGPPTGVPPLRTTWLSRSRCPHATCGQEPLAPKSIDGVCPCLAAPGGPANRFPFPRSTRHRRALPKFVAITLTSAQDSASETPAQHPALGPLRTQAGASAPVQRGESRLPFLGYRNHALAKGFSRTSHDRALRSHPAKSGTEGREEGPRPRGSRHLPRRARHAEGCSLCVRDRDVPPPPPAPWQE